MTIPSATRAAVRAVDAPFVFGLGLVGVGVAARVAWGARGGALVLLAPPALVAAIVAAGTLRVWSDLRAAADSDRALAAFEGREAECGLDLVRAAKNVVDRAASTLPSICILVGLLGTFAGLFEALVGARELLGSAVDAASLRAIVGAPLSGLARAFGSSAAGIVGSIVLGAAEGRFQGAADAVAVRIESIEERLRAAAIGEEVRRALTASEASAQERAGREARVEALLERVAKAVEAHAASHASYNQAVVGEIGRVGSRVDRLQVATEATQAAVRESSAASVASAAALEAITRDAGAAQVASAVKIEVALRELAASGASTASSSARVEDAVKAIGPAVEAAAQRAAAQASEAHREVVAAQTAAHGEAVARLGEAQAVAVASLVAAAEATRVELARAHREHEAREAEARRTHEERVSATLAASEARASEGSASIAGAAGALREHLARAEASLASAETSLAARLGSALDASLAAWSRRDEERASREETERRARWDDDDARRAEWSGAEKLVLQSAMDVIAERLAAVAEVHAKVLGAAEALSLAQAELRRASAEGGAADASRLEAAGDRMRSALESGAERVAEAIVRQSGALVEALRGELAAATASVEAQAAALASSAERVHDASAERVVALEAHAQSVAANAADVARAVETLAEVIRTVPLDAAAAPAPSAAAPQGSATPVAGPSANDEDRAAFVACLEEARRWFDATQALQQRLLDEASQLRGAGARP